MLIAHSSSSIYVQLEIRNPFCITLFSLSHLSNSYLSHTEREREKERERNLLDSFFLFFLTVDGASTIIREERPEKKTGTTRRTIPTSHTDLPSSHRRRSRRRSLRRRSTRFNSPFIFLIQRIR